ncbi:MAG TPA: hypothetical protein VI957_00590 [Candidatus Paceibacterota bacterium]
MNEGVGFLRYSKRNIWEKKFWGQRNLLENRGLIAFFGIQNSQIVVRQRVEDGNIQEECGAVTFTEDGSESIVDGIWASLKKPFLFYRRKFLIHFQNLCRRVLAQ